MLEMATSTSEEKDGENTQENPIYWKLAREGISLLLNNKQKEAEALFKLHQGDLNMATGYVYAVFVDALMSFEEDKIKICLDSMKELEKKCTTQCSSSWLKAVKSKVFGSGYGCTQRELECQIILADIQVFFAMLTFLQQDISGFIKGTWILRKSYKYYQTAYNNILGVYKEVVGDNNVPSASMEKVLEMIPTPSNDCPRTVEEILVELASEMERKDPIDVEKMDSNIDKYQNLHQLSPEPSQMAPTFSKASTRKFQNGYIPSTSTSRPKPSISFHSGLKNGYVTSEFNRNVEASDIKFRPNMKKSTSANSGLGGKFSFRPTSYFNFPFDVFNVDKVEDLDKDTITRLLCAVSFGYGLLQLGISLLPPTIMKLVNFLGFGGNRKQGIENLMYARKGDDLRAPFATLSLLWYHTIVRPFFALDGTNVQAGVQIAAELIEEGKDEFEESALFLFFRGRVERLRAEIPKAIETYQGAITNAAQKEIKLMSMHEVGWCYLIELNFPSSEVSFQYLKDQSRWSKSFYSYLCLINAGANQQFQEVENPVELRNVFPPVVKGTQLDEFLTRRYRICPLEQEVLKELNFVFWKILTYELLYLWNTLPSCNHQNINRIIQDCHEAWNIQVEPFMGLTRLIAGSCHILLGNNDEGVQCFREGIEARNSLSTNCEDAHVSAFTKYELGLVLIKNPLTLAEGKRYLESASNYKGYDFEQRLTVRTHAILKKL
ncbi:tetratricopeptide repeat protein 39C-like isoform X2 [Onthophagus taurus]|uniref:tetratricopeptide repeat protein 39C-like isoform X2 n=1 Tax=Onthophagus taurus TaxID=166361 RepID=UPI000C20A597|nr:tetratricopeptide repeat protein 39C-like isoform X2 [Onthophagus taurus]